MSAKQSNGTGALAGVRIIELAQFVFVPGGSAILSDHGAEVIKIEPPSGDPYRTMKVVDGRQTKSANLAMEQNNRNKNSVAIDLKSPEGLEVFMRLIETADVFLTSIRPDALDRLGVGVEALRKRNPKIIYVRGNALGFKGDQANRAGFDAVSFWARGGFAHALSIGSDKLVRQRPGLGDHTGSANIAMGVAMALLRRDRTGEPSVVEVSLLSTAMWSMSSDISQAQSPNYSETMMASVEFRMPLTRAYRSSDGRWIQLMFLDPERYWAGLCKHIDMPELVSDARFKTADLRSENGKELAGILDECFGKRTYAEWVEAFRGFDAPWEVAQTVREVLNDPQAAANGYTFEVTVEDGTPVRVVAGPVSIDGSPLHAAPRRAPTLGEHTDSILGGVGFSNAELTKLKAQGVIG
jgi:crotonobetainyl-CoA:carnitine CoA-transferase CaiB-like acyl-CoA transferase